MSRTLKYYQAVAEALDLAMTKDSNVFIMGLGVPDPKGIFGTTLGLPEKHGKARVMDMPASENGMTGVAIGAALMGLRPVMTHQRIDFALLALEQIVNQAANWHYMFGGRARVPLVIRMIIGRGWGQGPQHSQSLHAWFAHVPGLKVVMPATAYDAKGMLMAGIDDNNPVLFIEHRWLYNIKGNVPEGMYQVPLGRARVARQGRDITIAAISYMTLEALRAADKLSAAGIQAEVVDIRSLKPLDRSTLLASVRKTGRLMIADPGWKSVGFSAEIAAMVAEEAFESLKGPPRRVALPDCPTPTSPALAAHYYPRSDQIEACARQMLGLQFKAVESVNHSSLPLDVPDMAFEGPF